MRRRNITERREILAKDVNDLNDFIGSNFVIYSRDIMGISDGVASGLTDDSFSGLNLTIVAGSAFSNGVVYELLTDTTITLPNIDGVYKIYATKTQTSDLPISGYVLLDVTTREEDYDTVNSRTYDSLTLGATLSTVPSNAFLLGEATVSGGVITAYDDQRTLTSIGNLASNSIQAFSETARNSGTSAGQITGYIFDQTDVYKPFVKVAINDAFVGKAIVIDNGANAGTQGIYNQIEGNIGYYTVFSGSNGIGSYSELSNNNIGFKANAVTSSSTIGFSSVNTDIGFKSVGSNVGLRIESDSSNTSGIQIIGSNSGLDKGIEITNTYEGIVLENNNHNDIKITRDNVGGAVISSASIVLSLTNNDSDSATRFYFGIAQDLYGKNIAGNVVKFHPMALDSMMLGYGIEGGLSTDTATIGFKGSKLARGVYLEDNAVSVNILPYANQIGIQINGTDLINNNIGIEINNVDKPISIINDTNQSSALIELEGKEKSSLSSNGMTIAKTNIGLNFSNNLTALQITSSNNEGIDISNVLTPINISNKDTKATNALINLIGFDNTSNSSNGIRITDTNVGIRIESTNYGLFSANNLRPIYINNSITNPTSDNGQIRLIGSGKTNNNAVGIRAEDLHTAIKITKAEYGIEFTNDVDQSIYIYGSNAGDSKGIQIENKKYPISITNNSVTTTNAMIELNATTSSNGILINVGGDYGVKIQNTIRGIYLDSNVDIPFKIPLLNPADPNPTSPSIGDTIFKIIDSLSYEILVYDGSNWIGHA